MTDYEKMRIKRGDLVKIKTEDNNNLDAGPAMTVGEVYEKWLCDGLFICECIYWSISQRKHITEEFSMDVLVKVEEEKNDG